MSRAVASLMGGSGASGSETAQAIRALPAEQKVALIAAYQFIGAHLVVSRNHVRVVARLDCFLQAIRAWPARQEVALIAAYHFPCAPLCPHPSMDVLCGDSRSKRGGIPASGPA